MFPAEFTSDLTMEISAHPLGGNVVTLTAEDFVYAPENEGKEEKGTEGHSHVMIGEAKYRSYCEKTHVMETGMVMAELATNKHKGFMRNGEKIMAEGMIEESSPLRELDLQANAELDIKGVKTMKGVNFFVEDLGEHLLAIKFEDRTQIMLCGAFFLKESAEIYKITAEGKAVAKGMATVEEEMEEEEEGEEDKFGDTSSSTRASLF